MAIERIDPITRTAAFSASGSPVRRIEYPSTPKLDALCAGSFTAIVLLRSDTPGSVVTLMSRTGQSGFITQGWVFYATGGTLTCFTSNSGAAGETGAGQFVANEWSWNALTINSVTQQFSIYRSLHRTQAITLRGSGSTLTRDRESGSSIYTGAFVEGNGSSLFGSAAFSCGMSMLLQGALGPAQIRAAIADPWSVREKAFLWSRPGYRGLALNEAGQRATGHGIISAGVTGGTERLALTDRPTLLYRPRLTQTTLVLPGRILLPTSDIANTGWTPTPVFSRLQTVNGVIVTGSGVGNALSVGLG